MMTGPLLSTIDMRTHTASAIAPGKGDSALWDWHIVDETGSTNADLLACFGAPMRQRLRDFEESFRDQLPTDVASGVAPNWSNTTRHFRPVVLQARRQTAGRGRLGRAWQSQPGDSLIFSVGIVLPRALGGLSGLSLAIGVAIVQGLRALPLAHPEALSLKWPNDLLAYGAKLGGVLIETAASTQQTTALVIGVGLNLQGQRPALAANNTATAGLPPALLTDLFDSNDANMPTPEDLSASALHCIVDAIAEALQLFSSAGFAPFRPIWWQMHHFADQDVKIIDQGVEQSRGKAVGIDAYGRLLLESYDADNGESRREAISAGDVSLRRA